MKSSLFVGAVTTALVILLGTASTAPAFTPVFTAPMAFSWYAIRNVQKVFFFQGSRKNRQVSGYGADSNYGQGGGQYGSPQYRTRGD